MSVFRLLAFLFLIINVPAILFAVEPAKPKPDPRVADDVKRGVALYRDGDLVGARNTFVAVLKISTAEPKGLEYMEKIDKAFEERAEDVLKAARKARMVADRDLALLLDGQPNTAEGMKETLRVLGKVAEREGVPLTDLDWFMVRPSTKPFTGERAEKLNKLKAGVKGKR